MAFLQKKPFVSTSANLYTLASQEIRLIIGLGNPGKKYDGTRHNAGFTVIDRFAKNNEFPKWIEKKSLHAHISKANLGGKQIILAKPSTYMNDSGQAAKAIQHFYKISNKFTLVVYDDLAIGYGQLRTRIGGTNAGHNGVKSLIAHIGPDFGRLRIGIGNELGLNKGMADFVLNKFDKNENLILDSVINEACVLLTEYIFSGDLSETTITI